MDVFNARAMKQMEEKAFLDAAARLSHELTQVSKKEFDRSNTVRMMDLTEQMVVMAEEIAEWIEKVAGEKMVEMRKKKAEKERAEKVESLFDSLPPSVVEKFQGIAEKRLMDRLGEGEYKKFQETEEENEGEEPPPISFGVEKPHAAKKQKLARRSEKVARRSEKLPTEEDLEKARALLGDVKEEILQDAAQEQRLAREKGALPPGAFWKGSRPPTEAERATWEYTPDESDYL